MAIVLIKNTFKSWLNENPGFCILIGGLGARAPNSQTIKYYIRCFVGIRFRSSERSCVIEAACNAMHLLLGDSKASSMSTQFFEVAWHASQRLRPHDKIKAEISDFLSAGHLGPFFNGLAVIYP